MAKRLIKYNPAFLTQTELVDSFAVRHADSDTIVRTIGESTTGSNQHILVIGPRGMGKTTLILRAVAEVACRPELKEWYPLVFAEESYAVSTPGEFWLEALFHLGEKTGDPRWQLAHTELAREENEVRLREGALAQLMDFADQHGKRILLVVENLNMLLGTQMPAEDAWVLRHTLLNEPRIMLLATATSRFEDVENADRAMFELFKVHQLEPLNAEECRAFWLSMTGQELKGKRIRPLQILTGGNPRLLGIISSFAGKHSFNDLMNDLMQLVDDHTEYFKSHLDGMAPGERRIYLAMAELWNPSTTREVAQLGRMQVNETSALLNRLVGRGAVVVRKRGRTHQYQIAERMYNIYYLMRRRGEPSQRVQALVHFMSGFYELKELHGVVDLPLELRETLHAILTKTRLAREVAGVLQDMQALLKTVEDVFREPYDKPALERFFKKLLRLVLKAADLVPDLSGNLLSLAELFFKLKRPHEAEVAARKAIELSSDKAIGWDLLGKLLCQTKRLEEGEAAIRKAIELSPDSASAWLDLGRLLWQTERFDEGEVAVRKAIELSPDMPTAWDLLGKLLCQTKRLEEGETAFRKAIELSPDSAHTWTNLGCLLCHMERLEEGEAAFRRAIKLSPDNAIAAWLHLGAALSQTERVEDAVAVLKRTVELAPDVAPAWCLLGVLLCEMGQVSEAVEVARSYVAKGKIVGGNDIDAIDLFVSLAAQGAGNEAIQILQSSPVGRDLEAIIVGLRLDLGEDVQTAPELLEVGRDVLERIRQRRALTFDTTLLDSKVDELPAASRR